eukprot:3166433-Amphidinium_carterae.2
MSRALVQTSAVWARTSFSEVMLAKNQGKFGQEPLAGRQCALLSGLQRGRLLQHGRHKDEMHAV